MPSSFKIFKWWEMVGCFKEKLAAILETVVGFFFKHWIILFLVLSPNRERQLGHFLAIVEEDKSSFPPRRVRRSSVNKNI